MRIPCTGFTRDDNTNKAPQTGRFLLLVLTSVGHRLCLLNPTLLPVCPGQTITLRGYGPRVYGPRVLEISQLKHGSSVFVRRPCVCCLSARTSLLKLKMYKKCGRGSFLCEALCEISSGFCLNAVSISYIAILKCNLIRLWECATSILSQNFYGSPSSQH